MTLKTKEMKSKEKEICPDCGEKVEHLYQVFGDTSKYKWVCMLCGEKYGRSFGQTYKGKLL